MEFEIFEVLDANGSNLSSEVARLISQLSSTSAPTQADIAAIVNSEAATLLAARVKGSGVAGDGGVGGGAAGRVGGGAAAAGERTGDGAAAGERAGDGAAADERAGNGVNLVGTPTEHLAGCLVLVMFRIPTGLRARIEDVVVDEKYRGFGIGRALNQEALKRAEAAGARSVDLTSSPRREAANQLYLSLGFERRNTNVYRYSL